MSPWWRERIEVAWAPDAITLRLWSRGLRRSMLEQHAIDIGAGEVAGQWRTGLEALTAKLGTLQWRNASLDVVLSGHYVRYIVLPQMDNLPEKEAQQYARHQFQAVYGDVAQNWMICLSDAVVNKPRVAAATEQALIDGLRERGVHLGLRLNSVQPLLSAAFEHLTLSDKSAAGWLAVVEAGRLCVARVDRGHCISVRSSRYQVDPVPVLLTLLEQDALCAGPDASAAKLYLHSQSLFDCSVLRGRGWNVQTIATGAQ